jgi:hypothetical protein
MTILQQINVASPTIERASASAVCSHESFDTQVEGICHHSGRYLTRTEINPELIVGLREQHDFPGFQTLDELFARAVHAREYQHLIWSEPGIQGIALIITSGLLVGGAILAWWHADQWATLFEFVIIFLLIIAATIAGVICLVIGSRLFLNRTRIYHRRAANSRPAIDDFPLLCSYKIDAEEIVYAHLSNDRRVPPDVIAASGTMMVEVQPEPLALQHYETYRRIYQDPSSGASFHAGVIAADNLQHVLFSPDIEYSHRFVLHGETAPYLDPRGTTTGVPIRFTAPYQIQSAALYNGERDSCRFLLDFRPEFEAFDSYTLVLHLRWLGAPQLAGRLVECNIVVPPDLQPVTRVDSGRVAYEGGITLLRWRNLTFQGGEITLRATFSKPILQIQPILIGNYHVIFDGTLSGLRINPEHVWNVLGRHATERTQPSIRSVSTLKGTLTITTALLSQEHEYVFNEQIPIPSECSPNHHLIGCITRALNDGNVSIQRIEQAAPRLDPAGTLQRRMLYWDIIGRYYGASMYEVVDIHIVVSGYDDTQPNTTDPPTVPSRIDVRVRSLYDPRNTALPDSVNTTGQALADLIRERIAL